MVRSSSLIADGFHTLADMVGVFMAWAGLKFAQGAPDERFPYGYYKAENLSAFFVSLFIISAGLAMMWRGLSILSSTLALENEVLASTTAFVSIVVSSWMGLYIEGEWAERHGLRHL